jgi:flagellar motor switch protein FliN/FliY
MTQALEGIVATNRASMQPNTTDHRGEGRIPTAQIISLPDLHGGAETDGNPAASSEAILRDWNPLHQIKAQLQVCVGEATLTVGELLGAKEHQVIRLDREIDQAVDLTVEGKVVARGQLVAVDGHFAVRITELPVALSLTSRS